MRISVWSSDVCSSDLIEDLSIAGGVRGDFGDLQYDLSAILAQNRVRYELSNTVNPSLGPQSPTSFNAGKVTQRETQFHADFVYPLEIGLAAPLHVASGDRNSVVSGKSVSFRVDP